MILYVYIDTVDGRIVQIFRCAGSSWSVSHRPAIERHLRPEILVSLTVACNCIYYDLHVMCVRACVCVCVCDVDTD